MFHKLTEKQLDMFSRKLAELPTVQAMAHVGEDMKLFVAPLRTIWMQNSKKVAAIPQRIGLFSSLNFHLS